MTKKTKGWSEERRAKQAANRRKFQPERHSTGPKTPEGKAVSAQNAEKSGLYSAEMQQLKELMREQKRILKLLTRHET
ncbi:MAG: hypothetical protein R3E13_00460 [Alphaproteobacteria bacterium]